MKNKLELATTHRKIAYDLDWAELRELEHTFSAPMRDTIRVTFADVTLWVDGEPFTASMELHEVDVPLCDMDDADWFVCGVVKGAEEQLEVVKQDALRQLAADELICAPVRDWLMDDFSKLKPTQSAWVWFDGDKYGTQICSEGEQPGGCAVVASVPYGEPDPCACYNRQVDAYFATKIMEPEAV